MKQMQTKNITFSSIPTTCFRQERPAYFHAGEKPEENDEPLERFIRILSKTVHNDKFTFMIDGQPYMAHPKWLRDHVHEMKAFKHWEYDLKEYIDFIIRNQSDEGFFYEMVQEESNYHCTLMPKEYMLHLPESGLTFVRLEIEADIEYLVVEGAVTVYKATGDEKWIKDVLPALEKGINYITSDPKRWSEEYGVVKRAFTIDTWDFTNIHHDRDIRYLTPDTPMSVMHGDNSGVYQAMRQLAWLNKRFGDDDKANEWEKRASALKANVDRICWNGNFYRHQYHLGHSGQDDRENERLSLSNTYDMNRGFTTTEQSRSILEEYQGRRDNGDCFAEWFSIDPPYEQFGAYEAGSYINGAICSLTAGELAKAAFQNGYEAYGWDIIRRLIKIVDENGELFFMYNPKTGFNAGGGPSGWGAAAILSAIEEGLFGIQDTGICFDEMYFSPALAITEYEDIKYITGYQVSHTFIEMQYLRERHKEIYMLRCPSERIACHILLPVGFEPEKIYVNDRETDFTVSKLGSSSYADFIIERSSGKPREYDHYQKQSTLMIEIFASC